MKLSNSTILNSKFIRTIAFLLFMCVWITTHAQTNTGYSILVAGHTYGAHAGLNIGLHPPFLNKLRENTDSNIMGIFLTGDIVNQSTSASWTQVENELSGLGLNSYYVMGNHDNNSVGLAVFKKKHGGTYYSFAYQKELYIVLNSPESDRSISAAQLKFLNNTLTNSDSQHKRVFIFFHEVIWNSHEKYRAVRSNSRSRYNYMVSISNFWKEVFPMLTAYPEKYFYLFTGDVGGNPDAIAAFYDRWENVSLLSSGMGEVRDENYLKVNILTDTVTFKLIPLNDGVEMKPITWYNVPGKPGQIEGPSIVNPLEAAIQYQISPIDNATSYRWNLGYGISGNSDSSAISLHFDDNFQNGKISVSAINDGFGESEPAELEVRTNNPTFLSETEIETKLNIQQNEQSIRIALFSDKILDARLRIYDQMGKLFYNDYLQLSSGLNTKIVAKPKLVKGLIFIELSAGEKRLIKKMILH